MVLVAADRGKHLTNPRSKPMHENIDRESRTVIASLCRRQNDSCVTGQAGKAFDAALFI